MSQARQSKIPDVSQRHPQKERNLGTEKLDLHAPGNIVLVRNRMLYARAVLNAKGQVQFGLRHIRKLYLIPVLF